MWVFDFFFVLKLFTFLSVQTFIVKSNHRFMINAKNLEKWYIRLWILRFVWVWVLFEVVNGVVHMLLSALWRRKSGLFLSFDSRVPPPFDWLCWFFFLEGDWALGFVFEICWCYLITSFLDLNPFLWLYFNCSFSQISNYLSMCLFKLLSQIFALTNVFFLESLFFLLSFFNYFILCSLFIYSFAPLLFCFIYSFIYLF